MSGRGKVRACSTVLAGCMALALWTAGCDGDSLYEGVAIQPASVQLKVGQAQVFRATGGQGYEWTIEPADGRLGMNTAVGDTVVVVAQSNGSAGEGAEAAETVIALTCRSVLAGVSFATTNANENAATAYISIR